MSGAVPALSVPVCEGGVGPFAHRVGTRPLRMFDAAFRRWARVSRAGRYALLIAYHDAVADVRPGAVLPLPRLGDNVDSRTLAALERRGLVSDGALTPLAVETLAVVELPPRRRVETCRPVGDLL